MAKNAIALTVKSPSSSTSSSSRRSASQFDGPDTKTVKKRSRGGCRNCKRLKIKCDEQKPTCKSCAKNKIYCDYSLVLTWGGRSGKKFIDDDQGYVPKALEIPVESAGVSKSMTSRPSSSCLSSGAKANARKALSNQEVLRKISDFDNVFMPAPQQQPMQSFVMEFPLQAPTASGNHTIDGINSGCDASDLAENQSTMSSVVAPPLSSDCSLMTLSSTPSSKSTSGLSPSVSRPRPESGISGSTATFPNTNFGDIDITSSLGNVFDENDFLQPPEFIDDFIISEQTYNPDSFSISGLVNGAHAYSPSSTYKNALMQVPLRNAVSPNIHSFLSYSPRGDTPASVVSDSSGDSDFFSIPRAPLALPDILIQVPVYRDLFHHFVQVTADGLVPVPRIYRNNPFKTVLPRMAMVTPHLMSLLVAYAATHRARCLNLDEPVEMISKLLGRTFDGLTLALENKREAQSDATLATAMMLCSYSIVTTATEDSWKTHLHGAREIILARGVANSFVGGELFGDAVDDAAATSENLINTNVSRTSFDEDIDGLIDTSSSVESRPLPLFGPEPLRVLNKSIASNESISFLLRMLAYIDVIGALSSNNASSLLTNNAQVSQLWTIPNWNLSHQRHVYSQHDNSVSSSTYSSNYGASFDPDGAFNFGPMAGEHTNIDFLLGFDLGMIPVLSKVAALASHRRLLEKHPERFTPDDYMEEEENLLSEGLELSKVLISCCESGELRRKQRIKQENNQEEHKYLLQLAAMNLMFGYAGLIHLYRRVLRLTTDSAPVQELVEMITNILDECIPMGDSIEACLSFPIFTVGCEVLDPQVRQRYRQRMSGMQRFGFGQVRRAQQVMEECWTRNMSWLGILEEHGWSLVLA